MTDVAALPAAVRLGQAQATSCIAHGDPTVARAKLDDTGLVVVVLDVGDQKLNGVDGRREAAVDEDPVDVVGSLGSLNGADDSNVRIGRHSAVRFR